MRTSEGKEIHNSLIKAAVEKLLDLYKIYPLFYKLPNGKIVDIYAIKGKEKIIAECMILPSLKYMKNRIKDCKDYATKFIFVIPEDFEGEYVLPKPNEIWRIKGIFGKNTIIRISSETSSELRKIKNLYELQDEKIYTFDDIIRLLIFEREQKQFKLPIVDKKL